MPALDTLGGFAPFPLNVVFALRGVLPTGRGVYAASSTASTPAEARAFNTIGLTGAEALTRINYGALGAEAATQVLQSPPAPPAGPLPTAAPSPPTVSGSAPPAAPPLSTIGQGPSPSPSAGSSQSVLDQPLLAQLPAVIPTGIRAVVQAAGQAVRRNAPAVVAGTGQAAAINTSAVSDTGLGELAGLDPETRARVLVLEEITFPPYDIAGLSGLGGVPTEFEQQLGDVIGRATLRNLQIRAAQGEMTTIQARQAIAAQTRRAAEAIESLEDVTALQVPVTTGQKPGILQRLRSFISTPFGISTLVGAGLGALRGTVRGVTGAQVTPGMDPLTIPTLEARRLAESDALISALASASAGRGRGGTPQNRYCEDQRRKKRQRRRKCKQRANVAWTSGPRKGRIAGTKCFEFE